MKFSKMSVTQLTKLSEYLATMPSAFNSIKIMPTIECAGSPTSTKQLSIHNINVLLPWTIEEDLSQVIDMPLREHTFTTFLLDDTGILKPIDSNHPACAVRDNPGASFGLFQPSPQVKPEDEKPSFPITFDIRHNPEGGKPLIKIYSEDGLLSEDIGLASTPYAKYSQVLNSIQTFLVLKHLVDSALTEIKSRVVMMSDSNGKPGDSAKDNDDSFDANTKIILPIANIVRSFLRGVLSKEDSRFEIVTSIISFNGKQATEQSISDLYDKMTGFTNGLTKFTADECPEYPPQAVPEPHELPIGTLAIEDKKPKDEDV